VARGARSFSFCAAIVVDMSACTVFGFMVPGFAILVLSIPLAAIGTSLSNMDIQDNHAHFNHCCNARALAHLFLKSPPTLSVPSTAHLYLFADGHLY
jgi:hypothetical protein